MVEVIKQLNTEKRILLTAIFVEHSLDILLMILKNKKSIYLKEILILKNILCVQIVKIKW